MKHRFIFRFATVIGLGAVFVLALAACSSTSTDEGDPTPGLPVTGVKAASGGGRVVADPLEEYRPCDGSTSIYTCEDARGVGMGSGPTLNAAMRAAIRDAISAEAESQFQCQLCPDEEPCAQFTRSVEMGGAYVENPADDCEWLEGEWHCFAWVNFNLGGGGPPASAESGCARCPATPIEQTLIGRYDH